MPAAENRSPADRSAGPPATEVWVRRACASVVAAVAAYASYEHQRSFALAGGADPTSATLWPLSVDGLLVLATVGLLTPARQQRRRARVVVWLAFLTGIVVSLAANIAAAPMLAWQPVLVAGWPPVALLLAVELLAHSRRGPSPTDAGIEPPAPAGTSPSIAPVDSAMGTGATANNHPRDRRGAERIMWAHVQRELTQGRVPTGADLDRVAGTNNYGRRVLRTWRKQGFLTRDSATQDPNGGVAPLPTGH